MTRQRRRARDRALEKAVQRPPFLTLAGGRSPGVLRAAMADVDALYDQLTAAIDNSHAMTAMTALARLLGLVLGAASEDESHLRLGLVAALAQAETAARHVLENELA